MPVSTLASPLRRGERTNTSCRTCLVSSSNSSMPTMLPRAGRAHIGAGSEIGNQTLLRYAIDRDGGTASDLITPVAGSGGRRSLPSGGHSSDSDGVPGQGDQRETKY